MNCSLDRSFRGSRSSQEHLQLGSKASIARLCELARKWNEATKTASEVFAVRQAIGGNVSAATDLEPPTSQLNRRPLSPELGLALRSFAALFAKADPPTACCPLGHACG